MRLSHCNATNTCRTRHWPDRSGRYTDHDHETRVSVTCEVAQCRARVAFTSPPNGTRKQPGELSRSQGRPGSEGTHHQPLLLA
jgi:hypothetical protein